MAKVLTVPLSLYTVAAAAGTASDAAAAFPQAAERRRWRQREPVTPSTFDGGGSAGAPWGPRWPRRSVLEEERRL